MIPITIQQPFQTPVTPNTITSHLKQQETNQKISSHHSSPIPRLVIDEPFLSHLYSASNNTFKLSDPCILLKRTKGEGKEVSKTHPLYNLFLSQQQPNSQTPSNPTNHQPTVDMLRDIIFDDLYGTPHLYLPCLLELTSTQFRSPTTQSQHVSQSSPHPWGLYIHPESVHFGLQFTSSNNDRNVDTEDGLFDIGGDFWLVPISPHHIPLITKLHYNITTPSSLATKLPTSSSNPPVPAIPEAILHQMINNANQPTVNHYRTNELLTTTTIPLPPQSKSNPLIINCTKFMYSNIISTYSLFSVLKHRVTTIGGQDKMMEISINHSAHGTGVTIAPSSPNSSTALVHIMPLLDLNQDQREIEHFLRHCSKKEDVKTLEPHYQSLGLSKAKFLKLTSNILKKSQSTKSSSLIKSSQLISQQPSFSKWLSSMGFLYLLGQIIPPSSSTHHNTTQLAPLPFTELSPSINNNHDNKINHYIPILDTNHQSQLLSYTHSTLSLAMIIINAHFALTTPSSEHPIPPTDNLSLMLSQYFPLGRRQNESYRLPPLIPHYLYNALNRITTTLFANYTKTRPQNCTFTLLCGPHGSGKRHFISTIPGQFYQMMTQQLSSQQTNEQRLKQNGYPVIVSLDLDKLRQAVFHKLPTTLTLPYFSSPDSDSGSDQVVMTKDKNGAMIEVAIPQVQINNRQNLSNVLDSVITTLLLRYPSLIIHLNNVELTLPLQLPYQNSSGGNAIFSSETDQDYAILSYFSTIKHNINFNQSLFQSDYDKYDSNNDLQHGNQWKLNSLSVIATTTALQQTDPINPLVLSLFDDIVYIPTLNQHERYQYLVKFVLEVLGENDHRLSQLEPVLLYISSITRGCTISKLKLLIDRAVVHETISMGYQYNDKNNNDQDSAKKIAKRINLTNFSLLFATQSVQQVIEIETSSTSSGGSSNSLLSALSLFPTEVKGDVDGHTEHQQQHNSEYQHNKQNQIQNKSIWNIPVEQMSIPLSPPQTPSTTSNQPTYDIIHLHNAPQYIFYRSSIAINQLLTVLTAHVHILPALQSRFQQVQLSSPPLTTSHSPNLLQWLPTGMLLVGPHTSGKTYLLRTIVQHVLRLPCIFVSQNDIVSSYVGESEKNLRALFLKAQSLRPCVLIFDDLHEIAARNPRDRSGVLPQGARVPISTSPSRFYCPLHSPLFGSSGVDITPSSPETSRSKDFSDEKPDVDEESSILNGNVECLCNFHYNHFDSTYRFRDAMDDDGDDNDGNKTSQSALSELMSCLDKRHTTHASGPISNNNNNNNGNNNNLIEPIYVIGTTTSIERIPAGLMVQGRFERVISLEQNEACVPMFNDDEHERVQKSECNGDSSRKTSLFDLMNDILLRKLLTITSSSTISSLPTKQGLCPSVKSLSLKQQLIINSSPVGTIQTLLLTALQHHKQHAMSSNTDNKKNFVRSNNRCNRQQQLKNAVQMLFGELNQTNLPPQEPSTEIKVELPTEFCGCSQGDQYDLCLVDLVFAFEHLFEKHLH